LSWSSYSQHALHTSCNQSTESRCWLLLLLVICSYIFVRFLTTLSAISASSFSD